MTHDELLAKVELTLGTYISKYYGSKKDVELRSDVIDSLQALRAVVELHKPSITKYISNFIGCDNRSSTNGFVPYPCLTVQAIEKALGVRE